MTLAGPFSGAAQDAAARRPRSVPRWLSHVARGVGLWSVGALFVVNGVALVVLVVGFFVEMARVGGMPNMEGALVILILATYIGANLFAFGAGAGLLVALITLPLAWRRPGILPRIVGLVVAPAALALAIEMLTVEGLVIASITAGLGSVFVVAGIAGWFGAPWLWPPALRRRQPAHRVLPPPNARDRIARPFPTRATPPTPS